MNLPYVVCGPCMDGKCVTNPTACEGYGRRRDDPICGCARCAPKDGDP